MIEKTITDRVPTYPGRVKLTPTGTANIYTLERADEPTVQGTPIDKAMFDSIIQSRLTGRFYIPDVNQTVQTVQTGATVKQTPIPSSGWVLDSTQTTATSGNYKITVSSNDDSFHTLEKAVDGDISTFWMSSAGLEHYVTFEMPAAITVEKVRFVLRPDTYDYDITTKFQGSTNGSTWTDLLTKFDNPSSLTEYTTTTTGLYKYYRLSFSLSNSSSVILFGFEISKYDITSYSNHFSISAGVPSVWTNGQRIMIQTPLNTNSFAVTSNSLNNVSINTILQPSRRYELMYNGTDFMTKEV